MNIVPLLARLVMARANGRKFTAANGAGQELAAMPVLDIGKRRFPEAEQQRPEAISRLAGESPENASVVLHS